MRKLSTAIIAALLGYALALAFFATSALAEERILSYRSDITVNADATMDVTETIRVVSENAQIRHGIYREFPTRYSDKYGNRIRVGFTVKAVLRDGKPEPHFSEWISNGVKLYIGDKDTIIPPGEYTYTIVYRTNRQLGFFKDHDELYWNVTGNGWIFPMEEVVANVTLPKGVPQDQCTTEAYTGLFGDQGQDYTSSANKDGTFTFEATRVLNSHEGLTIVLMFPKGFVKAPTSAMKLWWFLRDNLPAVIALLGVLIILFYYMDMWSHYGRDPSKGIIFPQFKPPLGLSPATLRYVRQMGYDDKAFTATILDLAVKGCLFINEKKRRKYSLIRGEDKAAELPVEEAKVLEAILPVKDVPLEVDQENYQILQSGIKEITKTVGKAVEGKYYVLNSGRFGMGLFLSILIFAGAIVSMVSTGSVSPITFICFAILIFLNILFYNLLKAYTKEGRKLLDDIEGFRMYMSVAEEDMPPVPAGELLPEKTPGLFEEYLPYALALGVERAWAEKFAEIFARLKAAGEEYKPTWYDGSSWRSFSPTFFAGSMGSAFSSSISSSSSPPGSSSGGGGGGSSGGGGGGGGGGGW